MVSLRKVLLAALCTGLVMSGVHIAHGQVAIVWEDYKFYQLDSGRLSNLGPEATVVFERVIDMGPDVPWVRVVFSDARLGPGSIVKVTSLLDGEWQPLNARNLIEWKNSTAYFNGSKVKIEIIAGPGTVDNYIQIERVLVGIHPTQEDLDRAPSICAGADNRALGIDARVGRLLTGTPFMAATYGGGCTGFIINRPDNSDDKCHLSAGHCFVAGTGSFQVSTVMQFADAASQVSNANCSLTHPAVALQFAVTTVEAVNGGPGNDWAVYRCARNPLTFLSTFQTQGAAFGLAAAVPVAGAVTVNGFGVDGDAGAGGNNAAACTCTPANATGQRNQVQQTNAGALVVGAANQVDHTVDTCGGNSGGPIILNASGLVIGIHTHGGCNIAQAYNSGTEITLAALQTAISRCETDPPSVVCTAVGGSNYPGCCTFSWTITNHSVTDTIFTFYLDLEAGNGGPCDQLNPLNDVTAPPGYTASFCYPWDGAAPSNWAVVCFTGGLIPPGGSKTGQLQVITNGLAPANVNIPGWIPFTVPAFSIHCHATAVPPALPADCAAGAYGPHIIGQVQNWSTPNDWMWEPPVAVFISNFLAAEVEGGMELSWDILADEQIKGFRIYRAQDDGPGVLVNADGLIPPDARSYLDTEVASGNTYRYRLGVVGEDGGETSSPEITVTLRAYVFALEQNHPNPFNPVTEIRFTVDREGPAWLRVYDVAGREVRVLVSDRITAGNHTKVWDGRDSRGNPVSSGVYFLRLTAGDRTLTRKAVLLK